MKPLHIHGTDAPFASVEPGIIIGDIPMSDAAAGEVRDTIRAILDASYVDIETDWIWVCGQQVSRELAEELADWITDTLDELERAAGSSGPNLSPTTTVTAFGDEPPEGTVVTRGWNVWGWGS